MFRILKGKRAVVLSVDERAVVDAAVIGGLLFWLAQVNSAALRDAWSLPRHSFIATFAIFVYRKFRLIRKFRDNALWGSGSQPQTRAPKSRRDLTRECELSRKSNTKE